MNYIERQIKSLIVSGDLKFTYTECLDPSDWETKDAFRKVLKFYLTVPEYNEFLKGNVGGS